MSQITLAARVRKSKGKGAARKLRNNNQIPAIFYGPKTEPVMLVVDYPELMRVSKENRRENVILDLQIKSDRGTETRKAMIKDLLIEHLPSCGLLRDIHGQGNQGKYPSPTDRDPGRGNRRWRSSAYQTGIDHLLYA
jgi:large subunit ribosomal protein L25